MEDKEEEKMKEIIISKYIISIVIFFAKESGEPWNSYKILIRFIYIHKFIQTV